MGVLAVAVAAVFALSFSWQRVEVPAPAHAEWTVPAASRSFRESAVAFLASGEPVPAADQPTAAPERGAEPPRVVVATPDASAELADADWLGLPRCRRDLVLELVRRPQDADARILWRSVTFNPRDAWLSLPARAAVCAATVRSAAAIAALVDEQEAVSEQEFGAARERQQARLIDLSRMDGDVPLARLGLRPLFRVVDGRTFAVSRAQMPRTCELRQRLQEHGAELVDGLAAVFAAADLLTPAEQDAIVERARQVADEERTR
jgi:hypothetical protein